jgi:hypothetical protein
MPKVVTNAEMVRIEEVLTRHLAGLSISDIEAELGSAVARRTLNRRLQRLIAARRIYSSGSLKGTRYRYGTDAFSDFAVSEPPVVEFTGANGVAAMSLSAEAEEQRVYVLQPASQRIPVGYVRELLDDYVPNHSQYLPTALTTKLRQIGLPIQCERAAGSFVRDVFSPVSIDLSWASSRLEGNTYTRLDTQRLIDYGETAAGKSADETQMILNHKAAIELLVESTEAIGIDVPTILTLHALLSDGLMSDSGASGRLRWRPVGIGRSVYTPTAVPQLIEECFRTLITKAAAIHDPFEQAFFLMVHIPYLQPFEDVNKRVSRLAANIPLIKADLCPLMFIEVPETAYIAGTLAVYELRRVDLLRDVFEWAYERSCRQYTNARDVHIVPDAFLMKHRVSMTQVIGQIVRAEQVPTAELILALATPLVTEFELKRFCRDVKHELARLHEGRVALYKIKQAEFQRWKQAISP